MTLTSRLLAAFVPQQRALTPNQIFGADVWEGIAGTSGEKVTQESAMTLAAVWSAVRLLSQDVATLPFHAIEKSGTTRRPLDPQPDWLTTPQVSDANFTIVDYLSQVTISLLIDGNAFILVLPSVGKPFELTVLNPQRVEIKRSGGRTTYTVNDENGSAQNVLDAMSILHIPWVRRPGALRGLSPIQVQEETIGRALAAQEVSARFFKQGSLYGGFVEVPRDTDLSGEDVQKMLADIGKRHKGHRKSWLLGALTGGATFKQTMVNPNDSQTLETERWIREQIGSAYGIPPFLMGSLEPGAVSYASTEQQGILYKQSAVRPITERIEHAHSRLLGRSNQEMKFNLDGLLRADFKTRTEGYRELWNIGVLSADEIRAKEDLPPIPSIGATYWAPLNMGPAEQIINTPLNDPPGPRPAPQQEQPANG